MIRRKRRQPSRKGAALTEFAIVAPFLFLMLVGMIEFGRTLMVQHMITSAAHEAAREASLPSATEASVTAIVDRHLEASNLSNVAVTIDPEIDDAEAGDTITVTVTQPISSITVMGGRWFGAGFNLSSSSSVRKEGFE
ncbi:MAG: pilus assembly protein [Planctomycetales bacterium]|nr:pilus assembly protein [Planctomycetales bacterium]